MAALLVRMLAIVLIPEGPHSTAAVEAYLGGAHRLLHGDGFRDPQFPYFHPPLYGLYLAASFLIFGESTGPVRIAHAFADAGTVYLVYLLSRRLFGSWPARITATGLVFYPFTIFATSYIGTETFFATLFAAFVWLSSKALRSDRWRDHCAAGTVLGLATLTRGTTEFYPAAWLATLYFARGLDRVVALRFAAFCLCFALVIAPWAIRNSVVLGKFVPVASAGGVFFDGSTEEFFTVPQRIEVRPQYLEKLRARGIEQVGIRAGLELYRMRFEESPAGLIAFLGRKFLRVWYATESGRHHAITILVNAPILLLAAVGLARSRRTKPDGALLLLAPVLYFTALHWAVIPLFRYMVPVMPYLIALAGVGALAIGQTLVRTPRTSLADS